MTDASADHPTDRSRPPSVRHPGLDGLRGVAVALVVAYHLGFLRGGFLGVDVFFVLSGYLITALALAERDRTGGFGLRAFWGRRVRRLGPAVMVLVPVVLVVAHLVGWDRAAYDALAWDGAATLTWWMNWRQALGADSGYWGGAPSPFRHAWSLAIEEQFYLLWPLVLTAAFVFARRLRRPRAVIAGVVAGILAVASGLWSIVLGHRLPIPDLTRVYAGTDTRIVAPLAGCLLAAVLHRRRPIDRPIALDRRFLPLRVAGTASLLAVVLLSVIVDVDDPGLYRWGVLPLVAVLATVSVSAATTLRRIDPITSWLGRRSYGIYLWSWPIQVMVHELRPEAGRGKVALVTLPAALLAAEGSWWIVERPAQRRTGWAGPVRARRFVATAMVVIAAVSVAVVFDLDQPGLPDGEETIEVAFENAARTPATAPPGSPGFGGEEVLLLGDSVAFMFGYTAPPAGEIPGVASIDALGFIGCGQLSGEGYRYRSFDGRSWNEEREECRRRAEIERFGYERGPSVVLFVAGPWEYGDLLAPDGTEIPGRSSEMEELLVGELVDRARAADAVGARILHVSFACPGPRTEPTERLDPDYLAWFDEVLHRGAAEARALGFDAAVLEPTDAVCVEADPTGEPTPDKNRAFEGEVHVMTADGGRWAWETWLGPAITAAG